MANQNYIYVDDILKYQENGDYIDFEFYTHFSVLIDENEIQEFKDIEIFNQNISAINSYVKDVPANVVFLNKTFNEAKDISDEQAQYLDDESLQKLFNLYYDLDMVTLISNESPIPVVTTQVIEKEPHLENIIQNNTKVFLRNVVGFDGLGTVAIKISIKKSDLDKYPLEEHPLQIGVGKLQYGSDSKIARKKLSHYFDNYDNNDFIALLNKVNPNYVSELVSYMIALYKNAK